MDVRQLAFLAGQPAAAVKNREHFWGMPKRGLAFLLANVMFWQPMWAQADGIVVATPGTSLGQAGNGVPIVNIATPNGTGLSHNQFHDYNVGTQGVILNNVANQTGATQLGGIIVGNPNLTNGVAAQTILNEVVGGSPSQLRGYTEVAGQSARVIVANPYGISCNGCGFINTPRVTLTTGKPVLDNGRLDRFQVDQGSVSIDGAGLNANNVDRFEIITRSAKINAEIQAKNLTIIAGRNDVNADSLNATARTDDGSAKPQLAIDSSALGGMYAGAIKLVGTEAGVGVKLDGNLAASGGDIQLDANGHLSLAQTSATGAVNVKAASLDAQGPVYAGTVNIQTQGNLTNQQTLAARDSIALSTGGVLTNNGIIEAGVNADTSRNANGDVSLNAQNFNNTGKTVVASRTLTVNTSQTLNNQNGTLSAAQTANITAGTLDNQNNGRVLSSGTLNVTANQVLNTKGVITSTGNLSASLGHLNNRNGEVSSTGITTVVGQSLDNSGGSLVAQRGLDIRLDNALSNVEGLISSEGTLTVNAASLDSTRGNLSSAGALALTTTGTLINQSGKITTDSGLTLKSASLNNSQNGLISGKKATTVTTGAFDNTQGGQLIGGDTLNLTATQVSNGVASRIASDKALTASVTGFDQQGGQLFSKTSLSLDLNQGQLNNQNGLINAPLLMLKNLKDVNNDGGEISSAEAFTLAAQNLDNSNGKLLSNQNLTLRIDQALTNLKGGLIAATALNIKAASLDNSGGTLTSRANLDLNLDGLLTNQNQGLINATTSLTINSSGLNNQNGSLLGSAIAIDFGAATGDLNNSGGLITTAGLLSLQHLRDLNNRNGEISSSQSLDLTSRALDNSGGKLISSNLLTVNADTVLNQGGLFSGWQGLSLTSNSLDNRNKGTLSSHDADVAVSVSGALLNSGEGALVSQKTLSVNAASVDNSNGGILSSGGAQTLTLSGLLNNAQGGLIDSGATLAMQAMTLGNAGGTVNAKQDLSFTGTTLDNTGGNLVGNAAVTLDLLGILTNTNGKLASAGPLRVLRATKINNQGGQIASQGLMTLLTGGLDNRNLGTIAANDQLTITTAGTLQNSADGQIYSQNGDLQIQAASLANAKGTLQSQRALSLTIGGDIDNQSGRIVAKDGDLSIKATNLDNRGGVLASLQAAFTANLTGVLKNGYDLNNNRRSGVTQAQRLNLTALAGIDNYGGRIAAQSGDAIIVTGNFDNRNGGLYAKGKVNVTGNNFDNSGDNDGQIAGQQIDLNLSGALNNRQGIIESDSTLAIKAASLDNQTGQLRALGSSGKTSFQIGGLFDNRNGTLESANTDLTLAVGSFLNGGGSLLHVGNGTFDISTANVTGAGGSIVTRGGLTLNADSWTNSNVIQAGRLNVNVNNFTQTASGQLLASDSLVGIGVNWTNDGLIASDGTLQLNLSGAYTGAGRVTSLGSLSLSAASVNLSSAGRIAGGGPTDISASGPIINRGRITSNDDLLLNTASLSNYGTVGSAQDLTVNAAQLLNQQGLIFSGADMQLRSNTLTNSYGDIYSLGNLTVSRNAAGERADVIENISGSLESAGDMRLLATSISNRKDVLTLTEQRVNGTITHSCSHCSDEWNVWYYVTEVYERTVDKDSPSAFLTSGGNLDITGSNFLNQYSSVSAANNINITVDTFKNEGVNLETITYRSHYKNPADQEPGSIYLGLIDPGGAVNEYNKYSAKYVPLYRRADGGYFYQQESGLSTELNPDYDPSKNLPVPEAVTKYGVFSATQTASTGKSINAVIQSGGNTTITASTSLNNSVQTVNAQIVTSDSKVDATGTLRATTPFIVHLNSQLPPDLAQQRVDPLTLPGFVIPEGTNGLFRLSTQGTTSGVANNAPQSWTLGGASITPTQRQQTVPASSAVTINRVQGLPASSVQSKPQKYLIETNPVLTDLKQFMSSDYLLSNLGYDPDNSAKRLGDGLFEQRLVQQAVVARTGQRFINGQTSDEGLFKYLMNNAVASKQELNLSLGVSLTSEQVAALTHDIVWMETAEVNGEQVLVPVLYLAQANNRLAPNGALIAGNDITLIAGKDLNNAGTLRAANNLSATATNDLVNSGLVEAGERLTLKAGNDLTNKAGGIIAGRDVTLTTTRGDVINERTVSSYDDKKGEWSWSQGFADSAARIEAANSLTIGAGRDFNTIGSVVNSRGELTIKAGRDVNIVSAQVANSITDGRDHNDASVTQLGSQVSAGRDMTITAGRDLSAIASQIEATGDVSMKAVGDLTLASAADEQHSYSKTKTVTKQEDHVSQVSTEITAGGGVALKSGKDLTLISSKVTAGDEAYLVAGDKLKLLAAQDRDYTLYDMKKKGGFGSLKTQHDEVTDVKNVGSEIQTGGSLALISVGDQRYQGAKLRSGGDLNLSSGGSITFEAVKDMHDESHTKSDNNAFWVSAKGKGNTDETLRQSQLTAQGQVTINAVNGLHIDLKQIDQNTVVQSIDAMVKADPSLAWIKDAEQRGDVDWRQVKEIHESFKYNTSGLGPASKVIIAILMSAILGPAGLGLGGVAGAAEISLATTAVTSLIDEKGNLGSALKDTFSSGSLKNAAVAGITAGVLDYADTNWFGDAGGSTVTSAGPLQDANYSSDMLSWSNAEQALLRAGGHALINGGISTVINGGSFGKNLSSAALGEAINLGAAAGNKAIGDITNDIASKLVMHALLGGLLSKAAGQDFASGVVAGGVAEGLTPLVNAALSNYVSKIFDANNLSLQGSQAKITTAQLIGLVSGAMAGGDPNIGALIGGTAEKYNDQGHPFTDPTVLFGDDGAPLQGGMTALDKAKAQLSLAILFTLAPELFSEGFIAKIGAMFSEMGESAGVGVTASGGGAGGAAVDAGAGATASGGGAGGAAVDAGAGATASGGGAGGAVVDAGAGVTGSLPEIKVVDGFYEAEGTPFKFSEYYYNRLWSTGRGAPFVQADEVLKTATTVTPDGMAGFYRYTNGSMEMVYNPVTKEVWHIQPLR
jgi:filamentous hemagglutinin